MGCCVLLTLRMEIYTADFPFHLVETDIVKTFKASSCDSPYSMIGNQEMLLPSHEYVLILCDIRNGDWASTSMFLKRSKGTELGPVTEIDFCVCSPVFVFCEERIFRSDDLTLKIGCQRRMVLSQS